jgi:tRNA modification GTPase
MGNVLKNGIPVAIIGKPNVGKSTLLNALLNEEKAIVSEVAGTTRDSIEDEVKIGGISFRFIDTAGIRETEDVVENIGIKRTFEMVNKANIILYLVDAIEANETSVNEMVAEIQAKIGDSEKQLLLLANKVDKAEESEESIRTKFSGQSQVILLSALKKEGLEGLTDVLKDIAAEKMKASNQVVVSNARHYQALKKAAESLMRVKEGLDTNITGDFLAMDIRQSLHFLGEITGSIEIDRDILGHIFSSFCIGK